MLKFEYECWKCPKWHETTARGALFGIKYARPAVSIGRLRLTIPRIFSAVNPPRPLLVGNRGILWLVPLPFGYGLLIGATPRLWVGEWTRTLWEYRDHEISQEVRQTRAIMKRYKRGPYANQ